MLKLGATTALGSWDPLKAIDFAAEGFSKFSKIQISFLVINIIYFFMFERAHVFFLCYNWKNIISQL